MSGFDMNYYRETHPHEEPENHEAFRRASAVSLWELGSESWARHILDAYFDPDDAGAIEALDGIEETQREGGEL